MNESTTCSNCSSSSSSRWRRGSTSARVFLGVSCPGASLQKDNNKMIVASPAWWECFPHSLAAVRRYRGQAIV